MSVHYKSEKIKREGTQLEQAVVERKRRENFNRRILAGFNRIMDVLEAGGVWCEVEDRQSDLSLWRAINREVVAEIRDRKEEGYRYIWDDFGFMAQGAWTDAEAARIDAYNGRKAA